MAKLRNKKLINKKFQLKTTFKLTGILIVAFLCIVAITGVITYYNNLLINEKIGELNESIKREHNMMKAFLKLSKESAYVSFFPDTEKIERDHQKTMDVVANHIAFLRKIVEQNKKLLIAMVIIGLVLTVILYFYLINFTHRISGPMYVFTKCVKDLLDGRDPDLRALRKNDEFKEFHEQLLKLVEKNKHSN